jgi:hypothetical protein
MERFVARTGACCESYLNSDNVEFHPHYVLQREISKGGVSIDADRNPSDIPFPRKFGQIVATKKLGVSFGAGPRPRGTLTSQMSTS